MTAPCNCDGDCETIGGCFYAGAPEEARTAHADARALLHKLTDSADALDALLAEVGALRRENDRLRELLLRVEPELVPNHDEAQALADKFGLGRVAKSTLVEDIRAALAGTADGPQRGYRERDVLSHNYDDGEWVFDEADGPPAPPPVPVPLEPDTDA